MSGPFKVLALLMGLMLMLPGMARADFLEERIGQGGANSLLLDSQVALLSWQPAARPPAAA